MILLDDNIKEKRLGKYTSVFKTGLGKILVEDFFFQAAPRNALQLGNDSLEGDKVVPDVNSILSPALTNTLSHCGRTRI